MGVEKCHACGQTTKVQAPKETLYICPAATTCPEKHSRCLHRKAHRLKESGITCGNRCDIAVVILEGVECPCIPIIEELKIEEDSADYGKRRIRA